MIKPKAWNGKNLKGEWDFTIKLDGIRAIKTPDGYVSRNGKPLYNLDEHVTFGPDDCEVFVGDFDSTVSALKTIAYVEVPLSAMYSLDPLDSRLFLMRVTDPTVAMIVEILDGIVGAGNEGLVLRQGTKWLKVKKSETIDVEITGIIEGTGKYVGMLGAFDTKMGRVGTGLTDLQRCEFYSPNIIGQVIEVECMEVTKDGQFRLPRFKRHRWDK